MPHVQKGTWHHCPGMSGKVDGYPEHCRQGDQGFCIIHNRTCPIHSHWFFTMNRDCLLCLRKDVMDDKRRKTYDGEELPEEIEYTTETRTEIINGKRKKVEVKIPKNPVKKTTANMISKEQKMKGFRRKQRIEILAQKLPDMNLDENPIQDEPGKPLPLPRFDELKEIATKMGDNIGWKRLRPALVDEGVSDASLPAISPEVETFKAGKS